MELVLLSAREFPRNKENQSVSDNSEMQIVESSYPPTLNAHEFGSNHLLGAEFHAERTFAPLRLLRDPIIQKVEPLKQ